MKKTVFITGATSGFGKACAIRFVNEGWRLILAARRKERLQELQRELEKKEPVHIITMDVRHQKAVRAATENLPDEFKNIDVLINNAGLALGIGPSHEADLDDWETMVDTNIKGLMYCTHSLLPHMAVRKQGHIINVGSVAGTWPYPGGNVYGATKAFVKQFSNNLRTDLLGTQIRVTNIEPGMAESEFSIVRFKGDSDKAARVYEGVQPLTPDDIAEIIYWVANLPPHVNINSLEVMPTNQSLGPYALHRNKDS
ncbi:MAG: SDR family oxidoreductase [Deltaproteobacteria bacterium]|nr:SDR family oxidoreductase [Deltaproteobacteria bacterium]